MLTFVRVRVVFDNFAICDPIFKRFLSENVSKTLKMLTFVRVHVVFDNFAICDPIFKRFLSLESQLFDLEFLTS